MRAWLARTTELQQELASIAAPDPRWWLLAAGAALAEPFAPAGEYLACDAEPDADTLMAFDAPAPTDLVDDAIKRARAAQTTLRELHDHFPGQPLAVTLEAARGARLRPNTLDVAAFAIGAGCVVARLDDVTLPSQLAAALAGHVPTRWPGPVPFVCVAIGDEPLDRARHGHRRAWLDDAGPWLGLSRSGAAAVVSTCHLVVDGYGHARIAARIQALMASGASTVAAPAVAPALAVVPRGVPLTITWRDLPSPTPRLLPLAYRLGCALQHRLGQPDARFSPTLQIPVARGDQEDPQRLARRIVSATTSVRFERGQPEPFDAFATRTRQVFAREAVGRGLVSRLLAAANAVPVPLAWKRQSIGAGRSTWFDDFANVIGGRALLSRIALDDRVPLLGAASSPSRMASPTDPHGGCVLTLVDNGQGCRITVAGTGFVGTQARADAFLDSLLA